MLALHTHTHTHTRHARAHTIYIGLYIYIYIYIYTYIHRERELLYRRIFHCKLHVTNRLFCIALTSHGLQWSDINVNECPQAALLMLAYEFLSFYNCVCNINCVRCLSAMASWLIEYNL